MSYTEKKYSDQCMPPLSNYNLPHFHDFLLYIYYCFAAVQSFLYRNQRGCLESELLDFCSSPHIMLRVHISSSSKYLCRGLQDITRKHEIH